MPKGLFTDKKFLSKKIFDKILMQENNIKDFINSLTDHVKSINKTRENYKRDKQSRRLDAFARLLVADETCSAVSFDGEKFLIATNNNKHTKNKVEAEHEVYIKAGSTKEQIIIYPKIDIIFKIFDENREIQLPSEGKQIKCKFLGTITEGKEVFEKYEIIDDDNLKFKTKFDLSAYNIPFVPNVSIPTTLNKTFGIHVSLNNKTLEEDQLIEGDAVKIFNFNVPLDPLTRRAKKLTEYLAFHAAYSLGKKRNEKKELFNEYLKISDKKRYELLKDSLIYEVGHLYGNKVFNNQEKEQNRFNKIDYKNSKKKEFDDFILSINDSFNEFKKHKTDNISKIVDNWIIKISEDINNSIVNAPEYIKKDLERFFRISKRYFVDLEKLRQFVEEDVEKEGRLSQIWANDYDHSKDKKSFQIIDDSENDTHAELKLLIHYLNQNKKDVPYIATSILCCGMCNLIMDAFNINVSGTHANIYPWHLDEKFKDKLKNILPHEIYNKFLKVINSENKIITVDNNKYDKSDLLFQMIETLAHNLENQSKNHQPADDSDEEDYKPIEQPRYLQKIIFNTIEAELLTQINKQGDKQDYTFKFDKKCFNNKNIINYFKSKIPSFNEIRNNDTAIEIILDEKMVSGLDLNNLLQSPVRALKS